MERLNSPDSPSALFRHHQYLRPSNVEMKSGQTLMVVQGKFLAGTGCRPDKSGLYLLPGADLASLLDALSWLLSAMYWDSEPRLRLYWKRERAAGKAKLSIHCGFSHSSHATAVVQFHATSCMHHPWFPCLHGQLDPFDFFDVNLDCRIRLVVDWAFVQFFSRVSDAAANNGMASQLYSQLHLEVAGEIVGSIFSMKPLLKVDPSTPSKP
ncbi:hypothetical protein B0H34DRAFT_137425 [Crassisporium funariophilum]|nr:hypothetical protein B0H34DRAFT_137425 [Crassisporium funariophilum]